MQPSTPVFSCLKLYILILLFVSLPTVTFAEASASDTTEEITIEEIEAELIGDDLIEEPTVEKEDEEEPALEEEPSFRTFSINAMAASVETPTPPSLEESIFSAGSHMAMPNVSLKIGSAVMNYPIQVPPGRNGLAPQVSLNYNSSQGNGIAGVGWGLNTSVIQRSTRKGLDYAGTAFTFNGEDLFAINPDGTGYGLYRPEKEQAFSNIEHVQGTSGEPDYWVVTFKNGITQTYGKTVNAQQTNTHGVFAWYLEEVRDTYDNTIDYVYEKHLGQVYPVSISWVDGFYTLNFYYENRDDIIKNYTSHSLAQISRRLKAIEVVADTMDDFNIRAYGLAYTTSENTQRSLLDNITLYGDDYDLDPATLEVTGTSLPPTQITYTHDQREFKYSPTGIIGDLSKGQNLDNTYNYPMVSGDFNGDGRMDIGRAKDNYIQFYASTGTGFESFTTLSDLTKGQDFENSYEHPMVTGDWNGDGKTDVGRFGEDEANFYVSGENGFELYDTLSALTGSDNYTNVDEYPVVTGDFNGDGKTDIGRIGDSGVAVYHSTGNGFVSATGISSNLGKNSYPNNNTYPVVTGDFNGDGRTDIGRVNDGGIRIYLATEIGFSRLDGGLPAFGKTAYPDFKTYPIITGDFNGDGLTDIGRSNATSLLTYLSTGTGFATGPSVSGDFGKNDYPTYNDNPIFTGDFNDDGRTDVGRVSSSSVVLYVSTGTGFVPYGDDILNMSITQGFTNQSENPILSGDFTGTGPSGLARISGSGVVFYAPVQESSADLTGPSDLACSIVSTTGSQTQITYTPSSMYDNTLMPFVLQTVSEITTDDGLGNSIATSYTYSGGKYDHEQRKLRSFAKVTKTLPNDTQEVTAFHQDRFLDGMTKTTRLQAPDETVLSETEYTWEAAGFDTRNQNLDPNNTTPDSAFIRLDNKIDTFYENGSSVFSTETYTYDEDHGSILTQTVTGTGLDEPGITTEYEYAYFGDDGGYPLRTTSEILYSDNEYNFTRKSTYTYLNGTGGLESMTAENDGEVGNPVTWYTYDDYGNLKTITDAKGKIEGYTTEFTYDDTNTYARSIDKPDTGEGLYDHVSSYPEIDFRYGKPKKFTSENGFDTDYRYDVFGRVTQIDYPDGGQELFSYNDNFDTESPRSVVKQVKDGQNSYIRTITYMDGFDRTVQTVSKSREKHVITLFSFDEMGRQESVKGPFVQPEDTTAFLHDMRQAMPGSLTLALDAMWVKNQYDIRGRLKKIESNGDINTQITYNLLKTTVKDPDGYEKSQVTDILGRITKIIEHAPEGTDRETTYTYNIAGDLTLVSRPNPVTEQTIENRVTYNTLGQKTSMVDPDMGSWSYTYDLNGNLKTQTDSLGVVLTFEYDELNRQTKKIYPDESFALYTYDAATYGEGFLYQKTNAAGTATTTYAEYDQMGRPVSQISLIDDTEAVFDYTYDLAGRVSGKTISQNTIQLQRIGYEFYPGTSLLHKVTNGSIQAYAEITKYSPQGKIESISYGEETPDSQGAAIVNYAYYPKTGRLQLINSYTINGDVPITHKIYEYTKAGDIKLIQDVLNDVDRVYAYDHAHRLISEQSLGEGSQEGATVEVIEFTYDDDPTDEEDNPIHAPTSTRMKTTQNSSTTIETSNYAYGSAGNRSSKITGINATSYITNNDNMIDSIDVGGVITNFTYDADNQRVKKTQGAVTTLYYGQEFEIINNTPTFYLFAGNLRIGMIQNSTTLFFVKDHLGSTNAIIEDDGTIVDTGEYMPYGLDREKNDPLQFTKYKFTDQEEDDGTGLYNYDARLYDPVIGQFIMADTIVPDLYNPQSLNRYAYCLNNPVKYVDPTGHFEDYGDASPSDLESNALGSWSDGTSNSNGHHPLDGHYMSAEGFFVDRYGNFYGPGGHLEGGPAFEAKLAAEKARQAAISASLMQSYLGINETFSLGQNYGESYFESQAFLGSLVACGSDTCNVGLSEESLREGGSGWPNYYGRRDKLIWKRAKYDPALEKYRLEKGAYAIFGAGLTIGGIFHADGPMMGIGFSMAVENAWNAIFGGPGTGEEVGLPLNFP